MGVNSEHYGPLLIPIVLEKLPDEIKLEISRKLGKENWKIDEFLKILKQKIMARESCEFIKRQTSEDHLDSKTSRDFTTQALYAGSRVLKCAFCKQSHYSDKCSVVTDLEKRKEIVWEIDYVLNVYTQDIQSRIVKTNVNVLTARVLIITPRYVIKIRIMKVLQRRENPNDQPHSW